MKYFLIVYNTERAELMDFKVFSSEEAAQALAERFRREMQNAAESAVEVVLLRAESENSIRESHGRYFTSLSDLMRRDQMDPEGRLKPVG